MANNSAIKSMENPDLANQAVAKALAIAESSEEVAVEVRDFTATPTGDVELLAGLYSPMSGELVMNAMVRELTGADEEAVSKTADIGRGLMLILQRATSSIGDHVATTELLDSLLAGDREYLLLNIRRVTFGDDVKVTGPCQECNTIQEFNINLDTDVTTKKLADPIADRAFNMKCKVGDVRVFLPNGTVQKKLLNNADKTAAELDSILLKECVESINGMVVLDPYQVLNFGLADRRKLLTAISERNPGPELGDIKKKCSSCESEVTISLSLADLFLV
jgi:hypothetical protein